MGWSILRGDCIGKTYYAVARGNAIKPPCADLPFLGAPWPFIPASRYGVWCKWSAKFGWVKRCGSYDTHLDALRRAEREREFAERGRIYRRITVKALEIVEKRLDGFDPEELSQANVMEWLKGSIDIERAAFGTGGDGKNENRAVSDTPCRVRRCVLLFGARDVPQPVRFRSVRARR